MNFNTFPKSSLIAYRKYFEFLLLSTKCKHKEVVEKFLEDCKKELNNRE